MSNILLINDNVQDYSKIINACNDITYPITYNEGSDTYATIFAKYENLVSKNNIQVLNHIALVSHGSNNPEFTFLEKENKMLISHYIEDQSTYSSENVETETSELYDPTEEDSLVIEEQTSDSTNNLIINNLDTWSDFNDFIKKFNIQKSLDFLGCAILLSDDWKYVLNTLEKEQYLNLNIRASDDPTGNLKVGGDWVLESDNVNIKELYFINESIEKWYYTLGTTNFEYTGSVAFYTVPANCNSIDVKVWGADGGSGGYYSYDSAYSPGGTGGYSEGTISVTPGQVLYIYVGGRGYNWYSGGQTGYNGTLNKPTLSSARAYGGWGGDAGYGNGGTATKYGMAGGGAASQIRTTNSASSSDKSSILILAGGGGGGGNPENAARISPGGDGGGTVGEKPASSLQLSGRGGGAGGGQTPGQLGDASSWSPTGDGYPYGTYYSRQNLQGAGGGGYYGGGQGGDSTGGGGGSSYIGHSQLSNTLTSTGSIGYSNPASANPLTGDIDGKKHGYIRIIADGTPIPTSNISLSILKEKYLEYDVISGSGDTYLRDSSTTSPISLSYFNGVTLSDFTVISPPISFSQFSGAELLKGYDYPVFIFSSSFRSQSSFSISSTTSYGPNKKVKLITSGQTGYGNILPVLNGISGDNSPTISPTSDYTLWVKLTANSVGNYMIGLINRESWRTSWATCVSDSHKIKSQHAMYADRIMFHSYGYFTYSGNYKPSGTDPVLGSFYSGLGSVFYNKMGYTAGTGGVTISSQTFVLDNAQKFKSSDITSYSNAIAIGEHIGIRIKYFTATITATLTSGQNYVVISNQNLDDVFSGMRVSGTSIPTNTVLGNVYTDRIYLRDEYTGAFKNSSGSGTYTLTLTGQLLQFRKSNSDFSNDLLFGPPHIVLPLKYSTVNNNTTPNGDITDWSMIIGDTNGATDSQWEFEIVDDRPVLPEPSWSYPYSIYSNATGTDATSAFREISSRVIIDSSTSDWTGAWDVTSLQVNAVGSKRIYLALKVTASTTFYNDICIAGVQRISSSGTVLNSWIFNTSSGGTGNTWQTTSIAMAGSSSLLSSTYTPSSAASKSYSSIFGGGIRDKMNWATSTGSSYTGAAGGISTGSYGSVQFPVGNSKLTQTGTTYYAYREVSGSTRYTSTFFRSPLVTFNGTDTIKVAHLITTASTQPVNENDSIWLGVY